MKKMMIMMALAVAGWLGKAAAQTPAVVWSEKSGWHKIGEKVVDLKMESDEILVMGADKFSALKFKVTDAPIEILDAKVIFESEEDLFGRDKEERDIDKEKGLTQSISVNTPLQAGTETRVFELKGGEQNEIKKISFRYKTLPNTRDQKARIEIWGFKSAVKEKTDETKPEM